MRPLLAVVEIADNPALPIVAGVFIHREATPETRELPVPAEQIHRETSMGRQSVKRPWWSVEEPVD